MTTRILVLTALALALWCSPRVMAATYQWQYYLAPSSTNVEIVADGKGGAVVCYYNAASNAAYVTCLNKNGGVVWHKTYSGATDVRSKIISKQKVYVTVTPASGESRVLEIDMKNGTEVLIVNETFWAFTTDANVVAPAKDSKGFFSYGYGLSGSLRVIERYSFR